MSNSMIYRLGQRIRNELPLERFEKGFILINESERREVAVKKINLKQQQIELYLNLVISQSKNRFLLKMLAYEVVQEGEILYLATELCEGNLKDLIYNNIFSEEEARKVLKMIALGYESLFDNYIIHRDLKPTNILYKMEDGRRVFKIGDFGLSKTTQVADSFSGTDNYIAPEIKNFSIYDNRVDVWSLGITFLEMIKGSIYEKFASAKPDTDQQEIDSYINALDILSPEGKGFLKRLLTVKYENRMRPEELFAHPYLCDLNSEQDERPFMSIQSPIHNLTRKKDFVIFDPLRDGDILPNANSILYSAQLQEMILTKQEMNTIIISKQDSRLRTALVLYVKLRTPIEFFKDCAIYFNNTVDAVYLWKFSLILLEKLIILMKLGYEFIVTEPQFHMQLINDVDYKKLLYYNTECYFKYQKHYWMEKTNSGVMGLEPNFEEIRQYLLNSLEMDHLSNPENIGLLYQSFIFGCCVSISEKFKLLSIPKDKSLGFIRNMNQIIYKYSEFTRKINLFEERGMPISERENFELELREFTFSTLLELD